MSNVIPILLFNHELKGIETLSLSTSILQLITSKALLSNRMTKTLQYHITSLYYATIDTYYDKGSMKPKCCTEYRMASHSCGWSKALVSEQMHISISKSELKVNRYIFFYTSSCKMMIEFEKAFMFSRKTFLTFSSSCVYTNVSYS